MVNIALGEVGVGGGGGEKNIFLASFQTAPRLLSSFDTHARWQPVTQSARSRRSYGKIEDCEQSMVNTEATSSTTTSQLPFKEEDAISLEKGREEISTVFSDIFLYYGKCTSVTLG